MTLTILDLNASIDTLERSLAVIVSSFESVLKVSCCETGHSSGSTEPIATGLATASPQYSLPERNHSCKNPGGGSPGERTHLQGVRHSRSRGPRPDRRGCPRP